AGLAELDEFVRTRQTAAKIPGLRAAIGFHGQGFYRKGFAPPVPKKTAPGTPNPAFRTAPLAKPMTATAVMTLVEAGKLDLDAPIQQYCPAFPKKPWPITAR